MSGEIQPHVLVVDDDTRLRDLLRQFLSTNGVFRDVVPMVDVLCAQVYAEYICEQGGSYLLIEEHTPEGLRLNNPAGHLEAGEDLVSACAREAIEVNPASASGSDIAAAAYPRRSSILM